VGFALALSFAQGMSVGGASIPVALLTCSPTTLDYAAFIANSIIFLLIGIHEAEQPFALILPAIAVAILFVLLGRALSVYLLCAVCLRKWLEDMRQLLGINIDVARTKLLSAHGSYSAATNLT
jgi:NhaP-type Na+/H+ or K+/H+ antiporter